MPVHGLGLVVATAIVVAVSGCGPRAVTTAPAAASQTTIARGTVTHLAWHASATPALVALADRVVVESTDDGVTWRRAAMDDALPGKVTAIWRDGSGSIRASSPQGAVERGADGRWATMAGGPPADQIWYAPQNPQRRFMAHRVEAVGPVAGEWLRSTIDGGRTWTDLALPGGAAPYRFAIADAEGSTLFASHWFFRGREESMIWRSRDAGRSWAAVAPCKVMPFRSCNFLTDPGDPLTLYAIEESVGIGGEGNSVKRSTDGGETWSGLSLKSLIFLTTVLPTRPSTLIVLGYDTSNYRDRVLYASTDRGTSWTTIGQGLPRDAALLSLAFDPARPDVLFAGLQDRGVFTSTDRGRTWRPASGPRRPVQ